MKTTTIVLILLFACSIGSASAPDTAVVKRAGVSKRTLEVQFRQLEGKSADQVTAALGRPTSVDARENGCVVWRYRFKNGLGFVDFKQGKVKFGYLCDSLERQTGVIEGVGEEFLEERAGEP